MKFFFIFLFFIPIESLSGSCREVFKTPSLNYEKYSPKALEQAMNNMNYTNIIANYSKLSRTDERALFDLYKNGGERGKKKAFQILFLSNIYIVAYVVKKRIYSNPKLKENQDDLFQEGMIALLKALERFDLKTEVRFPTYLHKAVSSRLTGYIELKLNPIPVKWKEKKYAIYKAFQRKRNSDDFDPHSEVWIQKFFEENPDYSIKDIKIVAQFIPPKFLDYDAPIGHNTNHKIADTLSDVNQNTEVEAINRIDVQKIYKWTKERFPHEIDQAIIEQIIFSYEPKSSSELGNSFSITRQAITHRYNKIIREIRTHHIEQASDKIDFQKAYTWAKESFPHEVDQAIIKLIIFSREPKAFNKLGKQFSRAERSIRQRYNKIIRQLQEQFGVTLSKGI